MANPTGPANQPGNIGESVEQLKRLSREQGANVDLLKESTKYLKGISDYYEKINARANSYNQATINTKKLNSDLEKLNEKRLTAENNLAKIKDEYAGSEAEILRKLERQNVLEKQLSSGALSINQKKQKQLELSRLTNDEGVAIYKSALVALKTANDQVESGEDRLDNEKEIANKVGFTGNLLKQTNRYLGIGGDLYGKMVQEAREGESTTKRWIIAAAALIGSLKLVGKAGDLIGSGFAKAGSALGGLSPDSANNISKLTSGVSGMLKNIPLVGGIIGGMVDGFSSMLDFVIGIDDTIIKAGRNLGISGEQARKLNSHFVNVSMNNGDIFVTSKKLLETQVALGSQLGINNQLTDEQLSTTIKLKDIAGLDADIQASIVESSTLTAKSAKDTTKAVLAQVVGLQKATGISLNYKQVLKEASSLGGYLGLSFAKYPGQLTKSLVTTKAFGLELKQLDSMASSFLDFESSISSEFEAQLLTGKDINLSKARELFLNNDLASAAQEISTQVGNSADFLSMNRIQAESMAKAFGMSRDQLGDMLKKQEFLAKIGAKETDNSSKQLELARKRFTSQKELNEALGEEGYQNLVNASTQEKMSGVIDKIKTSIVDFVQNSGLIEKVQGFIDYIAKPENVRKIINSVKGFFADAVEFVGSAAYHIINALDYVAFGQIPNDFIESIKTGSANMGAQIRAIGGDLGGASVSTNVAKGSANAGQVAIAQGTNKSGETNINLRVEQMRDPTDPAKTLYRVVNESTHTTTDWQTGHS